MTRPYIILEGPDCGGKSTLAKELELRGYAVIHTGPPGSTPPYESYFSALQHLTTRVKAGIDNRPVVFDRFHLGERVYGKVLRENDRLGPVYHRMLDRILLGLGAVLVYCTTDEADMLKKWKQRNAEGKELVTDSGVYQELFQEYEFHFGTQSIEWHTYDYRYSTPDDLLETVNASYVENKGPGIGLWAPGEVTLLVGQQIARPANGKHDWPFVGISSSSFWLSSLLEEWKVQERSLYWINALAADGSDIDSDFLDELRPRQIIALGDIAADWCLRAGHRPHEVPHPSFWKRFKYGQPYPLKGYLK